MKYKKIEIEEEYVDINNFDKWLLRNKEVSQEEREIAIELRIVPKTVYGIYREIAET